MKVRTAAMILVLASPTPLLAQDVEAVRTVSVHGHAERAVTPDVAQVTLGIEVDDPDPGRASEMVATRSNAIASALASSGIQVKDQRTTDLSLGLLDRPSGTSVHDGRVYRASDVVTVSISPPSKAGAVIALVLAAGANRIDGVEFIVTPDPAAGDALRAEAVRDARRKADGMAMAAGAAIGEVMSIQASERGPVPMRAFRAMAADAVPSAPSVQSGTGVVSQDVDVVWTLR